MRNSILVAGILGILGWPSIANADVVAFWRFEEGIAGTAASGVGSVLDSSGNGLNGTPFLGPTYTTTPNPNSTLGLRFTGGNQRVFIPDNPVLALTHSLTLEAYIRFDGTPAGTSSASMILFRGDDRTFLDPYAIWVSLDGRLEFHVENAAGVRANVISPSVIPVGQYLHVAGTLDDVTGEQSLYINGIRIASQVTNVRLYGALQPGSIPGIGIGNFQSAVGPASFGGVIDELRISNTALPPSQFLNAVPEPSTVALFSIGLACCVLGKSASRRRSRADRFHAAEALG